MTFGIVKCRIVAVAKGILKESPGMQLESDIIIPDTNSEYSGLTQTNRMDHDTTKKKVLQKSHQRLRKILNSANMTCTINTFANPLLTYSFGIVK